MKNIGSFSNLITIMNLQTNQLKIKIKELRSMLIINRSLAHYLGKDKIGQLLVYT